MKFKVQIEEEDYIRFNIYNIFRSKTGKLALLRGRLLGLAISALVLFVMFVVGAEKDLIVIEAAFLAVFSVVVFFVFPHTAKKSIRKQILKLKEEGGLPYEHEAVLEFKDDEIYEETADTTRHLPYSSIIGVEENEDCIYLRKGAQEVIIVPERCLTVPTADFLSFMREKTGTDGKK